MTGEGRTPARAPVQPPAETRLRLAQEAGGVGLWEWDAHEDRVSWDPTCARIFGTDPETLEGTLGTFTALVHPDDRADVQAALEQALAERGRFTAHYRAVLPDGSSRHLLARGQVLVDETGGAAGVLGAVVDVTELRVALTAQARASRTIERLAGVAVELANARTVEDLVRVVIEHGLDVLGADGGAVCVRDDARQVVRLSATESLPERVHVEFAELPLDGPLPGSWVARHGKPVFLPDRAAGLAFSPAMQVVYDGTGRGAWATLPLLTGGRVLGSLVVSWTAERQFDDADRELLGAFAAQCAQALDRVQVLEAERAAARAALGMSEAMQRSLLSEPPQPDRLELVVRYRPAAELAQVGGDWYDAFLTPDGATNLVIGDVTGHDRDAAARMGTVRNLLRGTAYALPASPASVLSALERAMAGLEVDAMATAVVARIEQTDEQLRRGARLMRWSNAGHLPPVLLSAAGTARVLRTDADLLLGLVPGTPRVDHTVELLPGDVVLLFTDGLVERRGEDLDVGLERLRAVLESSPGDVGLSARCDAVLTALLATAPEDDVALLALQVHPQDG